MSQAWPPLERSQPDLRLWSLNVVALTHRKNEKAMELGGSLLRGSPLGRRLDERVLKHG